MTIYHYTYLITNCQEEKYYIGSRSCDRLPEDDLGKKYFSSSRNYHFIKDQKTNRENYHYQILETFQTKEEALLMEISLHDYFDVGRNERFYNLAKATSTGFDVTGMKRPPRSAEYRAKLSAGNKGKRRTEEEKKHLSEINTGAVHTDEAKKKISDAKKGISPSEEHREKLRQANLGKKASPETKLLLSSQRAGKKQSKHHIEMSSDSTMYRFIHPEHGERITTRFKLIEEFDTLTPKGLSDLKIGHTNYYDGWYIKPFGVDYTKHKFIHPKYGIYIASIEEMLVRYNNLKWVELNNLVHGKRSSYFSWEVEEIANN
jgi:hypothetical protein